jgi:hypothetical protein
MASNFEKHMDKRIRELHERMFNKKIKKIKEVK